MNVAASSAEARRRRHLDDWRGQDRGSVEVEFALGTVVLLAFLMLAVGVFRVVDAEADVQMAASRAARSASRQDGADAAASAAQATAMANLTAGTTSCRDVEVDTATGEFEPGGSVTVTVRCTVDYSDLVLVSTPGRRHFASTATAVVDRFRGNGS